VLAPLRVARTTWPDEARQVAPLQLARDRADRRHVKERQAALKRDAPIFTTNYEQLPWLVEHYGDRWPYRHIIADESTRLKSRGSGCARAAPRSRAGAALAHKVVKAHRWPDGSGAHRHAVARTGSSTSGARCGSSTGPAARAHSFSAFTQRWFRVGRDGFSLEALPHAQAEIQHLLKDICLTLDPKDWFDLREPIRNVIQVELPKKRARGLPRHGARDVRADRRPRGRGAERRQQAR
jgi:hypothetical protein